MKNLLNAEAISDFGCNVASGVVIETFRDMKSKPKIIYINSATLWRNYVNCLDGKSEDKIKLLKSQTIFKKVLNGFIEDTRIFLDNLKQYVDNIVIYKIDYSVFFKKHKKSLKSIIEFKGVNFYINSKEPEAITLLEKSFKDIFKKYVTEITNFKEGYILTHNGLDLLPLTSTTAVKLVESHTGEIKSKNKWYTKMKKMGKNSLQFIPFNEMTYFIFGDDLYVKPQVISIRKHLIALSKSAHWLYDLTSREFLNNLKRVDAISANEFKRTFKVITR